MEKKKLEAKPVGGLAAALAHRILFVLHLFAYVAVIALLNLIWVVGIAITSILFYWPFYAMFGWGFGIGFHAICYLMYNDKVSYLAKVRRTSVFGIFFIFHAWFYVTINIFLFILNLTLSPTVLVFQWPLLIWGLGFFLHALGFSTWDKFYAKKFKDIKGKYTDYSEKQLKRKVNSSIAQYWLLLVHVLYYVVVNIWVLIFETTYATELIWRNQINAAITWGIILGAHIFHFYLFNYQFTIEPILKSLYLHMVTFLASIIWLSVLQFQPNYNAWVWIQYPLILWSIALVFHLIISFKWDVFVTKATNTVKTYPVEDLEEFEVYKKAVWLIFWECTFLTHGIIYIVGAIMLGIQLSSLGFGNIAIFPIMGWLIGLCCHGGITYTVLKNITTFLKWTAVLHISVYIPTSVFLVIINVLFTPTFLWSAIAIGGWGIGVGFHLVLLFLLKK